MASNTPNIDRLEALILEVGTNASVSVLPYDGHDTGNLWSVSDRIGEAFVYGQGHSLATALDAFTRNRIAALAPSTLAKLDAIAAPAAQVPA